MSDPGGSGFEWAWARVPAKIAICLLGMCYFASYCKDWLYNRLPNAIVPIKFGMVMLVFAAVAVTAVTWQILAKRDR